ncbi:MAG: hypothetical protein C0491_05440 [Novosphingobium sp.]|nr:hypothetical protein [Novosphingobium sp.]
MKQETAVFASFARQATEEIDLNIAQALRRVQIALGLASTGYLCWLFVRGEHFGDTGTTILLIMFAMSVAVDVAYRRVSR